jgi:hypothetical protein
MLGLFQSSEDHCLNDAIDILLGELGEDSCSGFGLGDQSFQVGNPFRTENFRS